MAYEQGSKELTSIVNKTKDLVVIEDLPDDTQCIASSDGKGATEGKGEMEGTDGSDGKEGILGFIRKEGARRLSELERIESHAEDYLDKFGVRIGQFLREAVSVQGPAEEGASQVLFDAGGKKWIPYVIRGPESR